MGSFSFTLEDTRSNITREASQVLVKVWTLNRSWHEEMRVKQRRDPYKRTSFSLQRVAARFLTKGVLENNRGKQIISSGSFSFGNLRVMQTKLSYITNASLRECNLAFLHVITGSFMGCTFLVPSTVLHKPLHMNPSSKITSPILVESDLSKSLAY